MLEILKLLPFTFIPLFVAIDIFGVLPIFTSLTSEILESEKRTIIRHSTITALIISLIFVALGEAVFKILGITVDDFKIAGGLLLLILAVIEIVGRGGEQRNPHDAIGVVPIGVPLIVGPAVLTTLIVLIDHYGIVPTVISLVLNLFIVWIAFIGSHKITGFIGKNGVIAISKIMALLLAAIAIMMIRIGIENLIK